MTVHGELDQLRATVMALEEQVFKMQEQVSKLQERVEQQDIDLTAFVLGRSKRGRK